MSNSHSNPTLHHLSQAVQQLCPLSLADRSWDNVGVMVEPPTPRAVQGRKRIVCCIDLTTAVTESAVSHPTTSAILTYHPPIFSGLKSLTLTNSLQRSLLRCVQAGVPVLCVHTAADNCIGGTNDYITDCLLDGKVEEGVREVIKPCEEKDVPGGLGQEGAGSGRTVVFKTPLSKEEIVRRYKKGLGLTYLQAAWAPNGPSMITRAAICAGSGSSVLKNVDTDIWVTGEASHHDILAANAKGVHVLLSNHSASERPWLSTFAPKLEKVMNELAALGEGEGAYEVVVSEEDREPLEVV
ncbi:NGG1p interacting factor 3 [Meredithblackwellia eburnea MCA 4105]